MADTNYGVNHPLAVKVWRKKLFHEVIGMDFYGKFMGEGSNNIFQVLPELKKGAGDTVYQGLRNLLTASGVQGDDTLEGREEELITYRDALVINQIRHAVKSAGKMSEQRVPFSVREEARTGLQDWFTERMNVTLANQLTGNTAQTDTLYTGNNATIAPSTAGSVTRIIIGGGHTAEGSLSATTTHAIKLNDLDKAVALAKTQQPRIRPVKVDGKSLWVCFLHPYQIYQLRQDASTAGNFFDIQKAQLQGGKISDNPILTGGEFIYNGVIVHEWDYLPNTVSATGNTNYRRGVLCGAQACLFAYGKADDSDMSMNWVEELFDYKNKLGVSSGLVFGVKKSQFNSKDFGTIVLSGYAPAPA